MSRFSIDMSVGRYCGSSMSIDILANDQTVYSNVLPPDQIHIDFDCELPAQIKFVVNNKQPFETELDVDGNIIADKHIKIDRLVLDRMPVDHWILEGRLVDFMGQKTNYFSTNGQATITITTQDSFEFFLDLMNRD